MARPRLGETDTERLHLKITRAEIDAIEDWRYANRVPSKSEAVRRLVQIALAFDEDRTELFRAGAKLAIEAKAIADRYAKPLEAAFPYERRDEIESSDLVRAALEISSTAIALWPLISKLNGVSNRLRSGQKLEDVILDVGVLLTIKDHPALRAARGTEPPSPKLSADEIAELWEWLQQSETSDGHE